MRAWWRWPSPLPSTSAGAASSTLRRSVLTGIRKFSLSLSLSLSLYLSFKDILVNQYISKLVREATRFRNIKEFWQRLLILFKRPTRTGLADLGSTLLAVLGVSELFRWQLITYLCDTTDDGRMNGQSNLLRALKSTVEICPIWCSFLHVELCVKLPYDNVCPSLGRRSVCQSFCHNFLKRSGSFTSVLLLELYLIYLSSISRF